MTKNARYTQTQNITHLHSNYNTKKKTQAPSEIEKVYFAGIFDGEGCIYPVPAKRTSQGWWQQLPRPGVCFANCNRGIVETINKHWPGTFRCSEAGRKRPCWFWSLGGFDKMRGFLLDLLPYLRVKKNLARVAIHFADVCIAAKPYEGGARKKGLELRSALRYLRRVAYLGIKRQQEKQYNTGEENA